MNLKEKLEANRRFLKAHDWNLIPPSPEWEPDHRKGVAAPTIEKPYAADSEMIPLTPIRELDYRNISLQDAILNRKSRRNYSERCMSMDELSFLLWATQAFIVSTMTGLVHGGPFPRVEPGILLKRIWS